jgi:hypothetical protein
MKLPRLWGGRFHNAVGVGVGVVFASFIIAVGTNPSEETILN